MGEGQTIRNVSGGYTSIERGVSADDTDNLSLQAISAFSAIDYIGNLTIEEVLSQLQYQNNFDPSTQVSAVDMTTALSLKVR